MSSDHGVSASHLAIDRSSITDLLTRWSAGEPGAANQLLPRVYPRLRRMAARVRRGERQDLTLQATAIVHEAYLELAARGDLEWQDRGHFFGFCAHLMRRLMVRHSRQKKALKRGGGAVTVRLDEHMLCQADGTAAAIEEVDAALGVLERHDRRKLRIVELRVFGGFTIAETADALGTSPRTVDREWKKALAWLVREMDHQPRRPSGAHDALD